MSKEDPKELKYFPPNTPYTRRLIWPIHISAEELEKMSSNKGKKK